jgi:hypothetical protein
MKFQLRFCFFDVLGFEFSVAVRLDFFGSFQRECVLATQSWWGLS